MPSYVITRGRYFSPDDIDGHDDPVTHSEYPLMVRADRGEAERTARTLAVLMKTGHGVEEGCRVNERPDMLGRIDELSVGCSIILNLDFTDPGRTWPCAFLCVYEVVDTDHGLKTDIAISKRRPPEG